MWRPIPTRLPNTPTTLGQMIQGSQSIKPQVTQRRFDIPQAAHRLSGIDFAHLVLMTTGRVARPERDCAMEQVEEIRPEKNKARSCGITAIAPIWSRMIA